MTEPQSVGSPELEELARAVRDLNVAAALTDTPTAIQNAATDRIKELTEILREESLPRIVRERPFSRHDGLDGIRHVVINRFNGAGPEMDIRILGRGHVNSTTQMTAVQQGPIDSVHGGISAWLMDTVLGVAVQSAGYLCVTGTLSLRYENRTPLNADLQIEGRVVSKEGRKIHTTGSIIHNGTTTVTATGVFIEVPAR